MSDLIYQQETYDIIGICMEVHKFLVHGFTISAKAVICISSVLIRAIRGNPISAEGGISGIPKGIS